jgi:hypothetical protein
VSGNRARLTITLGAAWRPYTPALPGWIMVGTVERGAGDVGALGLAGGTYWQVNNGVARVLDQRKVLAALSSSARKTTESEHPAA